MRDDQKSRRQNQQAADPLPTDAENHREDREEAGRPVVPKAHSHTPAFVLLMKVT